MDQVWSVFEVKRTLFDHFFLHVLYPFGYKVLSLDIRLIERRSEHGGHNWAGEVQFGAGKCERAASGPKKCIDAYGSGKAHLSTGFKERLCPGFPANCASWSYGAYCVLPSSFHHSFQRSMYFWGVLSKSKLEGPNSSPFWTMSCRAITAKYSMFLSGSSR